MMFGKQTKAPPPAAPTTEQVALRGESATVRLIAERDALRCQLVEARAERDLYRAGLEEYASAMAQVDALLRDTMGRAREAVAKRNTGHEAKVIAEQFAPNGAESTTERRQKKTALPDIGAPLAERLTA